MSTVEALALCRLVLVLLAVPFAVRGRYWFLTATLGVAVLVNALAMGGVAREVTGALAVPLYGLLALHAVLVSRVRRTRAYREL